MGITLRGIGGLGQRPGELGGQELRSKIKKEIKEEILFLHVHWITANKAGAQFPFFYQRHCPHIKNLSFSIHTSKIFSPGHYLLHQKTRWYLHTPLSLPSESSSSADVSVCLVLLCHKLVGCAFSSGSHRGLLSWLNPASTEG